MTFTSVDPTRTRVKQLGRALRLPVQFTGLSNQLVGDRLPVFARRGAEDLVDEGRQVLGDNP